MEGNIYHFLHRHSLMLMEEVNHEFLCHGCKKSLSPGPIYGCNRCEFYLHKTCTELPRQIQNFFHPCPLVLNILSPFKCNACLEDGSGFSYHCKRCDFNMHVECAQRPNIKSNTGEGDCEEIIQHFTHWHPLRLVDEKDLQNESCGICEKQMICFDSGPAVVYGCEECNFFLHKSCMINIPQQINHLCHSSYSACPLPLILIIDPSGKYFCAGCGDVISCLVFRCRRCNFHLDVKCALLPTADQSNDADEIQYVAHEHPLVALPHNNKYSSISASEVRCRACGENFLLQLDPCYACVSNDCDYFIHRKCAISVEFTPKIKHHFHPLHSLTLSLPPPAYNFDAASCRACLGSIDEFLLIYRCANCNFNLHVDCAKPTLTSRPQLLIKYEGHSHPLSFFDKTHAPARCYICDRGTDDHTACNCLLRCVACKFDIHLHCHPSAPKTIKHKCHIHPLTLTRSPFEYELISPLYQEEDSESDDEFYCDVCEEKRFKKESVYYCQECEFIAETRCVISEILPSVTGSDSEGNPIGDARVVSLEEENSTIEASIEELNNEIAKLRAKKKLLRLEYEQLNVVVEELYSIERTLKGLETDRYMLNYKLYYNLKQKNISSGSASTSKQLAQAANLP